MKILVTNDDGINAPGIAALVKALQPVCELCVVAPDRERSTVSHCLTLHKPLRLNERKNYFGKDIPAFELNGMPADCVKVGTRVVLPWKADLVVAGINEGPNLGTDVVYSGTVSAAREAVIEGYPGIAISLTHKKKDADYSYAAEFIKEFIFYLKANYWYPKMLLNINIHAKKKKMDLSDFKITKLGERKYEKLLEKRKDPSGHDYYWMSGEIIDEDKNEPKSDVYCILTGKISVTPLHYDYTHQEEMTKMEEKLLKIGVNR